MQCIWSNRLSLEQMLPDNCHLRQHFKVELHNERLCGKTNKFLDVIASILHANLPKWTMASGNLGEKRSHAVYMIAVVSVKNS